jgi:hypothetical protein
VRSAVTVPSAVRATTILGASGGAARRQAIDGSTPPGTSDDDAPEVSEQAVTVLPKWMIDGGASHPRPGGNDGCVRRGRRRQWPRGMWVDPAIARGRVISGDGVHARRGWL